MEKCEGCFGAANGDCDNCPYNLKDKRREETHLELVQKIVYFEEYCSKCKHVDKNEDEQPCDECLSYSVNDYSHKPVKYEEEDNKRR